MSFSVRSSTVCLSLLVGACAPIPVNSPMVLDKLKLGQTWLCTSVGQVDGGAQYHCAPAQ